VLLVEALLLGAATLGYALGLVAGSLCGALAGHWINLAAMPQAARQGGFKRRGERFAPRECVGISH
jgi:hypothetical protein